MALAGRRVIVVGAGIGGLAAALALRNREAEVVVLERMSGPEGTGVGIQISPNGFAVLRALGLGNRLAGSALRSQAIVLTDDRQGDEILRMGLDSLYADGGFFLSIVPTWLVCWPRRHATPGWISGFAVKPSRCAPESARDC